MAGCVFWDACKVSRSADYVFRIVLLQACSEAQLNVRCMEYTTMSIISAWPDVVDYGFSMAGWGRVCKKTGHAMNCSQGTRLVVMYDFTKFVLRHRTRCLA